MKRMLSLLLVSLWLFPGGVSVAKTSFHPAVRFLDQDGKSVIESHNPVSTMRTCGECHDTGFIAGHSYHVDAGFGEVRGEKPSDKSRPWELSSGFFGGWNPITYRYLSPPGITGFDLGTASWIMYYGIRHVGGGPALYSRTGIPLEKLGTSSALTAETIVREPESGTLSAWNWQKSGGIEMNCFLCHIPLPDYDSRKKAIQDGAFRWANTATLAATGIVEESQNMYRWNARAFDKQGYVLKEFLNIRDPENENCGYCHGIVHTSEEMPLISTGRNPESWNTERTGQIISPQRIAASGMNIKGKTTLSRSWDIHAERLLECIDCHHSLNNPVYRRESGASKPEHLLFDARRMEFGEYLKSPSHEFAKGQTTQKSSAPLLDATMRRCESCHDAGTAHDWLPYKERHMAVLSCESCHIPKMYSPARQSFDWTVIDEKGEPRIESRGTGGKPPSVNTLIEGFDPVLLPRKEPDGRVRLLPHNLITAWYWTADEPRRPVSLHELRSALFEEGAYSGEILSILDENKDGKIADDERMLNSPAKIGMMRRRLEGIGLKNVQITGEILPFGIHHGVTSGAWATSDCGMCHGTVSKTDTDFLLASRFPSDSDPVLIRNNAVALTGTVIRKNGALFYRALPEETGLYLLGHDKSRAANIIGIFAVMGTMLGVMVHGAMRYRTSKKRGFRSSAVQKAYIYSGYERLWHWLQALGILALIITGLEIHMPGTIGLFGFAYAVRIHSILGFILVANATLAAFYHVASGEIIHYFPEPRGFFTQAIIQMKYYLGGIFRSEPHPFEKSPRQKLNPLQQVTYLAILNVLLPVQVLTGMMIWGLERWTQVAELTGGLRFLLPVHAFAASLFAAFLIMHIYLTTTGYTPLSNIRAMISGWDENGNQKS